MPNSKLSEINIRPLRIAFDHYSIVMLQHKGQCKTAAKQGL
jgi:hypothetical protein